MQSLSCPPPPPHSYLINSLKAVDTHFYIFTVTVAVSLNWVNVWLLKGLNSGIKLFGSEVFLGNGGVILAQFSLSR